MQISLSDHFTYQKLLRFVAPSILMMIITSIYSIVDGFFRLELRRQKFVCRAEPHLSRHHGARRRRLYDRHGRQRAHRQNARRGQAQGSERDLLHARHRACRRRRDFKRRVHRFPAPHLVRRRATDLTIDDCVLYGRVLLAALPFFMLQNSFQSFLATAEKPHFGLRVTVFAG